VRPADGAVRHRPGIGTAARQRGGGGEVNHPDTSGETMITIELLEKIEQLLPGRDDDSALRRRVVRILADAGGELPLDALHAALGPGGRVALALVASWDGLYWSTPRMVRLAPWVRRKLELELPEEEGPHAVPVDARGTDPLAGVRAAVARATNVSTPEEALAHARTGRVRLAS
jgi:hypothetical protein